MSGTLLSTLTEHQQDTEVGCPDRPGASKNSAMFIDDSICKPIPHMSDDGEHGEAILMKDRAVFEESRLDQVHPGICLADTACT